MEYLLGKLVCGLKKRREKKFCPTKNVGQKVNGFRPEWDDEKSWTELRFFSIMKFLDKICDEKLHRQSEEKIPK